MPVLPFTTDDAVTVLKKSQNLNSALKNFLKREIKAGDPAGRFIKDLKDLSDRTQTEPLKKYLDNSRPHFDGHLLAIGRYAHVDAVNSIVGQIVDRFAEDFNATYEIEESGGSEAQGIKVKDANKFKSIVDQAFKLIDDQQGVAGYSQSTFFKNLVLLSVFEKPVLDHIMSQAN